MINIGSVFTKIPQEFFHMPCQQAESFSIVVQQTIWA